MAFQSAMNRWEIHKEIAQLGGVVIDPPDPDEVRNPKDLTRYYLQYYIPSDSESRVPMLFCQHATVLSTVGAIKRKCCTYRPHRNIPIARCLRWNEQTL
mmetsp:Transcript_15048/g.22956  ORF Transcript_15048/g.22956 Transcript_15048/m.22956 type:complete len:99 (+) Transcript_15048:415-711(+)